MYREKNYTDDELIRRVWDQEEIRNLIGRYAYFEAANQREEIMDRLWVRQPEHAKTASLGRNWGFLEGLEAIRDYYVNRNRFGGDGTAIMHPLSTKLICEAEDGQTAQGIWMGIGSETAPGSGGGLEAIWINERIAVDFCREDGQWRIWHMFIGTNYVVPAGKSYAEQPLRTRPITREEGGPDWYVVGSGRQRTRGLVAEYDQIPVYGEREAFLNGRPAAEVYTALYNDPLHFPPLPEPYRTFAETVGYDRAGFERVSRGAEGRVFL